MDLILPEKTLILYLLLPMLLIQAQSGREIPELKGVDSVFAEFIAKWNVPGASIAISKEGKLVYARGFGFTDEYHTQTVQPYHKFRVASLSKPITAVAILKLYEQNRLNLDDKVFGSEGILNDSIYSSIRDSSVKDITINDLLYHLAGWDSNISGDPMFQSLSIAAKMNVEPPPSPETIIKYILKYDLNSVPGVRYAYSNLGYCILGEIISKVSGMDYEEFVDHNILEPLGMQDTELGGNLISDALDNEVFYNDYANAPKSKSIYGTDEFVPTPYGGFDLGAMKANGGWVSTSTNLIRFALGVDGFKSKPDILSPAAINIMRTPSSVNPNYARGWAVNSAGNWWHNGSLPGTSTILVRTSSGQMCWTVLINYRPMNFGQFNNELDNVMWQAINTIKEWPEHDLFDSLTVIDGNIELKNDFQLFQNYPNPFNASTKITYRLDNPGQISVRVYNIIGERIAELENSFQESGLKQIVWDANNHNSGIYFIKLKTGTIIKIIKAILLK